MRKVFLDNLPIGIEGTHKGKILWRKSIGYKISFIYEDIKGEFEIIDSFCEKGSSKVKILYNNKPFIIACNHLREGKIGRIIGKVTIEFKLNIGTMIGRGKIVDREYRINKRGQKRKYYLVECQDCGDKRWIGEGNLTNQIYNCIVCGDKISIPNKAIAGIFIQLRELGQIKEFERECVLDFLKIGNSSYPLDILDKTNNVAVEADAKCRNNHIGERKKIDDWKDLMCKKNGIIIIRLNLMDKKEFNRNKFNYIKKEIIEKLSNIYNLDEINWERIFEFITSNEIKEICDFYNKHKELSKKDIAEIFGKSRVTINAYIKQGEKLGWVKNVKERGIQARYKRAMEANEKRAVHIIVKYSDTKELVREEPFLSQSECSRWIEENLGIKLCVGYIGVCRKNNKSYKGFIFEEV